jgi:hypothetical protein
VAETDATLELLLDFVALLAAELLDEAADACPPEEALPPPPPPPHAQSEMSSSAARRVLPGVAWWDMRHLCMNGSGGPGMTTANPPAPNRGLP